MNIYRKQEKETLNKKISQAEKAAQEHALKVVREHSLEEKWYDKKDNKIMKAYLTALEKSIKNQLRKREIRTDSI